MRKIAVYVSFMNDRYRAQLRTAASEQGFDLDFYDCSRDSAALLDRIGDYEIIYGHPDPAWLKRADRLRWLCSDFAGVEKYLDEAIWPSQGCLLSNSSGAYGPAIAEHIVMVLLMLLRRMPEYQSALAERSWPCLTPIRSLAGSQVVALGTGDVGRSAARRLKALGASVTGVCRSGRSEEPAFDRVLPIGRLDELLPQADSETGRGGAYKNGDYQVDEMNIVYDEVSACFTVNLKVSWKGSGISAQTPEDGVVIRCLNPPKKEGTP